jgi:hypothetical protein
MNVVLNWIEELKRRAQAGKRIGRCHSEKRREESLSALASKRRISQT